ncbi:hypothetical protein [Muribaculum intestinale]|uniref:hypothetical protein n=1 Tax=Muribaculum intestinale TaxID=1796646 RepID=UPI0025AA1CE6|nr:hypothetical protein [Muribaculum intestinale]
MYGTYSQEYRLRQYNEIYEKRHKKLEECIAQLKPAEQPEAESKAPETDEAEEAVTDPAEDAPQEIDNDTEEAAA